MSYACEKCGYAFFVEGKKSCSGLKCACHNENFVNTIINFKKSLSSIKVFPKRGYWKEHPTLN